ncbi:MAG TPA: hypothetical protein VHX38_09640 [Pseudonocardiaceae bacterium]|jgi:hypothetical protein|nr:hypothetical protein [Pseudonocardiaceae bacterium]
MEEATRLTFERLFDTFERSAWRLECQGIYDEPEEREPMRRFLAGEPNDMAWFADWPVWIRNQRESGRTVGRVRMLTDPLTDYLRFELSITPPAVDAGEDIRLVDQHVFESLEIPREDFWIFDDSTVALLHFGGSGVSGAEIIIDPGRVASFRDRQRCAWDAAVPYR